MLALPLPASLARADVVVPQNFYNQVVRPHLDEPNSFAFLPDGRVLLTEQRTGSIRMVVDYEDGDPDPLFVVPGVDPAGYEHGLQGIAVDPGWPARPYVYIFYDRVGGTNCLVRYTVSGDLNDPHGRTLVFSDPRFLIDDIPDVTPSHNSGCLRFGPDGMLYVSVGDDFDYWCDAADRTTLRGEILRLDVSNVPAGGGPQVARSLITPSDNPWVASSNENERLVFAYGMRNPWRFQIDPATGVIYSVDVGEFTWEEMNEIHAGDFMGWPWREGNMIRERTDCPEPGGEGTQPYVPAIAIFDHQPDSLLHAIVPGGMYRPVTGAPSNWPSAYYPNRGDVFYLDYYVGDLKRITWDGANWVPAAPVAGQPSSATWGTGFVNAVDFQVGPDGSLWWLQQFDAEYHYPSGSLNRVVYSEVLDAGPPQLAVSSARLAPNPADGLVTLRFTQPRSGRARVSVYGVGGRLVRVLCDGWIAAGEQQVTWDGTDASGRPRAAGVYFIRLERDGSPPVTLRSLHLR